MTVIMMVRCCNFQNTVKGYSSNGNLQFWKLTSTKAK